MGLSQGLALVYPAGGLVVVVVAVDGINTIVVVVVVGVVVVVMGAWPGGVNEEQISVGGCVRENLSERVC